MPEDASVQRASLISDPPGLTFTDVKPGDEFDKTVTVTNTAPYPVELSSHVTRDGRLFQGTHPLVVSFEVATPTGSGGCAGVKDAVQANATATIHVHAAFPAEAGNEYQSQSGAATLFFTATQLTAAQCDGGGTLVAPPIVATPPQLPSTGIDASGVIVLAVLLIVLGASVRTAVRHWTVRKVRE